jgi:hypothetical protein
MCHSAIAMVLSATSPYCSYLMLSADGTDCVCVCNIVIEFEACVKGTVVLLKEKQ